MSFILLGILNSQVTGAAGGSYELIESNILTSSASSVTFSSIPQDYKHLQIRFTARDNGAGGSDSDIDLRFNSDSGSNYSLHRLVGTGSSVTSDGYASQTSILIKGASGGQTANAFGVGIIDILDYASTSKNTTARFLGGQSTVRLHSGAWLNTAAVTSITLNESNNFIAGSRFSLYGVKG